MLQFFSMLPWRPFDNVQLPDDEVMQHTTRFFLWETPELETLAVGGEMFPSLAGEEVYLWLALAKREWPCGTLREGMRLVHSYLSSLPWRVKAEACAKTVANQSFLLRCGFVKEDTVEDRIIYSWS